MIYYDNLKEHKEHIHTLLQCFRKHSLFTKANEYEWHQDSIEFLGYILMSLSITMADNKAKIIQDCLEHQKIIDIQSFFGFANFYRQFIYNFLEVTVLLTQLTQKCITWHFSQECCSIFEFLKNIFTPTPILTHWIPNQPLVVETNASDYALAAILSMYNPDGKLHPIAFHS